MKYHIALIISRNPINLPEDLSEDKGVQHLIIGEFEMDKDIGYITGLKNSARVEKSAPEHCDGMLAPFVGRGPSISVAILDWLKNLCGSTAYRPLYFGSEKTNEVIK